MWSNQYDKAYRYRQEVHILDPRLNNYIGLAINYERLGMEKEAYELLNEAQSKFGESKGIKYRKAWFDLGFKNDATALIELMMKDIEGKEDNIFLKQQLASFYVHKGQYKMAIKYLSCYDNIPPCESSVEFGKVLYAYALKKLGQHNKSSKYIDDILQRNSKFLQPESSKYQYNFRTLAGAHAMKGNADSTIFWLQEWKKYGNYSLNTYTNMPPFKQIWETPSGQKFIKREKEKVDSMVAIVRKMKIKG